MTADGLEIFRNTLQKTHEWLVELMRDLRWDDEHKAYLALRAVLQALRDRLTVEEAAQLGAQLPMLVRGFYFEGWDPTGKPMKERHQEEFLAHIKAHFRNDEAVVPERVARAVFKLLTKHISEGEIKDVKHTLPAELRALWP
ncbi:MAG TPA: DUF2267 domain-containing protein [Candidatus Acidoferrales bacterium]|nr:DUF2267 domain-containing protein [Candidatus Acidoferrales bacterium]